MLRAKAVFLKLLLLVAAIVPASSFAETTATAGAIGQLKEIDIVTALGVTPKEGEVSRRFEYFVAKGRYDIDLWLEKRDTATLEMRRLLGGASSTGKDIERGNILFATSDSSTCHCIKPGEVSITFQAEYLHPRLKTYFTLDKYSETGSRYPIAAGDVPNDVARQAPIELGKEIVLLSWTGDMKTTGTPTAVPASQREVYLKVKFTKEGELARR